MQESESSSIIGSAYLTNAQLNYSIGNNKRALQLVEEGKSLFNGNSEDDKIIYQNLDRIGLSIYSSNPSMFQKAIKNFENSIQSKPNDLILKLSYAGLLAKRPETEYQNRSLELLNDDLKIELDNLNANINLGAHYVNKAVEISKKISDTSDSDSDEFFQLENQVIENLKNAYPYINKLHQLQTEELEWVCQLINIVAYMPDKEDELNRLQELKIELEKY